MTFRRGAQFLLSLQPLSTHSVFYSARSSSPVSTPPPQPTRIHFLFVLLLLFIFYRARKSLWKNITKRETCSKHLCKVTGQTLHSKCCQSATAQKYRLVCDIRAEIVFFSDQTATTAAFTLISSVRLLLYLPLWLLIKRQLAEAASRYCHT